MTTNNTDLTVVLTSVASHVRVIHCVYYFKLVVNRTQARVYKRRASSLREILSEDSRSCMSIYAISCKHTLFVCPCYVVYLDSLHQLSQFKVILALIKPIQSFSGTIKVNSEFFWHYT